MEIPTAQRVPSPPCGSRWRCRRRGACSQRHLAALNGDVDGAARAHSAILRPSMEMSTARRVLTAPSCGPQWRCRRRGACCPSCASGPGTSSSASRSASSSSWSSAAEQTSSTTDNNLRP
ncbi:jg22388 [Pararge aegeria aegeria]|uniref:Jg22388 protein n=1 Tax=Pararge aegeria aegeria TaxID=348720 RepID=A0A8S4QQS4_9NEOP|nr:jg22388 [Pararge aegeria aegeria]